MEIVTDIKGKTQMPYALICRAIRIPLSTLGRWRSRQKEDRPLLNRPGPRKVEPFDPAVLETEIKSLDHGTKRSEGATGLYKKYQESLSRRDLARMVEQMRREVAADRVVDAGGGLGDGCHGRETGERKTPFAESAGFGIAVQVSSFVGRVPGGRRGGGVFE